MIIKCAVKVARIEEEFPRFNKNSEWFKVVTEWLHINREKLIKSEIFTVMTPVTEFWPKYF